MARKKKEEITQENDAIVSAPEATVPVTETKTETKKPVRRGRTAKAVKKDEPTTSVEETRQEDKTPVRKPRGRKPTPKTAVAEEIKTDAPMGTPLVLFTVEESSEKKEEAGKENAPEKPKRGRKTAKKTDKEEVKQDLAETVSKEEKEVKEVEEEKALEPESEKKTLTNAQKNEAIRAIVKELLSVRAYKWNELLDGSSKLYSERIDDKDAHSANDVRGRIGSVFDGMKKTGEAVLFEGAYTLRENVPEKIVADEEKTEETPTEDKKPLPLEEVKETPVAEEEDPKATVEEKTEEKKLPAIKPEAKLAPVFDMTLLLGGKEEKKGDRVEKKPLSVKKEEVKETKPVAEETPSEKKEEAKAKPVEEKKAKPVKTEKPTEKTVEKKEEPKKKPLARVERKPQKTAEEKLKESFLKKIRSLGGKYFEYYSVYLLERYSLRNGRRIDGLRVSGGDNDGGIDGEIEVTDRIGFKETIYIQAKNWNPMYGKEESWVIGETMLQQFIGAVTYRQAREGKQHTRGIFVTTSYFTSGAKEMLDEMSDKFVGYDGDDLFEAAKECSFGLLYKDGQWTLDEKLLSGDKAFFNLY